MTSVAPNRRLTAVVALAAGAVLGLTACGSGQISQMSTQVAAVNGTPADQGSIDLRNVHILFADPDDTTLNKKGGTAVLAFVAINMSETQADKLESISPVTYNGKDLGTAEISPASARELKPQTRINAVSSAEAAEFAEHGFPPEIERDQTIAIVKIVDLKEDIIAGLTVQATFNFENAGAIKVEVPVDGRDAERRNPVLLAEEHAAGAHATPADEESATADEEVVVEEGSAAEQGESHN